MQLNFINKNVKKTNKKIMLKKISSKNKKTSKLNIPYWLTTWITAKKIFKMNQWKILEKYNPVKSTGTTKNLLIQKLNQHKSTNLATVKTTTPIAIITYHLHTYTDPLSTITINKK